MNSIKNETKEQLLARLDRIHGLIAGSVGLTIHDTKNIIEACEIASGETTAEFEARCHASTTACYEVIGVVGSESEARELAEDLEWLNHQREINVRHIEPREDPFTRSGPGHPHGWSAVCIPEWDVRQKLDAITETLAGLQGSPDGEPPQAETDPFTFRESESTTEMRLNQEDEMEQARRTR